MSRKIKIGILMITILLVAVLTMATAKGWVGPLSQIGMGMPTDTTQPQSTASLATPFVQDTPAPLGNDTLQSVPSPTMTSIFTGFTPYPNAVSTYVMPMGGSGMMGGAMMGSSSGMTAGGSMGTSSMDMSAMGTSGCSMMSGSSMGSSAISDDSSMAGMGMSDDSWIAGMDMSALSSSEEIEPSLAFTNPWWILGWVVLALVILAILAGAVVGIVWLVRRSREAQQAQP